VGDGAWVCKVVDTSDVVLGQEDRGREEISEKGVGLDNLLVVCRGKWQIAGTHIWNINNFLVF